MAESQERTLPSLVADDLVDLVRESLVGIPTYSSGIPLTHPYTPDEGEPREVPLMRGDGRPVALDYAVVELLVEIRDGIRGLDEPVEEEPDQSPGRPVVEADFAELERRLRTKYGPLYLGGRLEVVLTASLDVFARFLRERGVLA